MSSSAAILIGSAISAIVAVGVVGLQHSLERRRKSLADRAGRLGDFLAATFAVSAGIEQIATASSGNKGRVEAAVRLAAEDQLNRCLTSLRLLEDSDVVASATYLERELTRITGLAQAQVWSREDWRGQRASLARLTDEYEAVGRRKLGRRGLKQELSFYVT
jgi:hypothetical protein